MSPTTSRISSTPGTRRTGARFYERLARSFRLILFDKRGTGLSDGGAQFATLETRMEDLGAVLDAVGSERAVVFAGHEGCAMASLYAATYPERVSALVLFQPGWGGAGREKPTAPGCGGSETEWGTQEWCDELLRKTAPSLAESEDARDWFANWLRVGASPAVAYALNTAFFETDLADILPAIRVPTLVLYRGAHMEEDSLEIARRIPSAHAVRLAGEDYWGPFLSPEIVDEIERFVAGEPRPSSPDRVLATVMFTDIVGSTERAAELGDQAWRELLDGTTRSCGASSPASAAEERDTAGDGFLATFDGPARAIRCAQAIVESLRRSGSTFGSGLHAGECERRGAKLGGIAVHIGARVAAWRGPERCSSRARSRTSSPARGSSSRTAGRTS